MKEDINFADIRPYNDSEIPEAVKRITENVYFQGIANYIFPNVDLQILTDEFRKIKTVDEFQVQIMDKVIRTILAQTADTLSYTGFERLSNEKNYLFLSNHRDILLDSAILQIILHKYGLKTSEITFGSNLMSSQFVIDIGKVNKMFKIVRGGTSREIFFNSLNVSQYMRYAITQKQQSIWIAQRNGRAKNGFDCTEVAVLKMLAMSSQETFVSNLMELNITPLAISYEYEPCDFLKTQELYISRQKQYVKTHNEDMNSIIQGIRQWKGNIHLAVCETITENELKQCDTLLHNKKFKYLAEIIDKKIYQHYKLHKTNYIAHDLLHDAKTYTSHYSNEEKEAFKSYMQEGLENIDGEMTELETLFLQIYAVPVENAMLLK